MLQIFRFHHRSSVHPNAIEGDESCPDAVCFNSCTLTHAFFHMTPRRRTHAHTYARCLQATERPQRPQPASYLRCPGAFERLRVISPDPESQMSLNMRGFNREEVLFFSFFFFFLCVMKQQFGAASASSGAAVWPVLMVMCTVTSVHTVPLYKNAIRPPYKT